MNDDYITRDEFKESLEASQRALAKNLSKLLGDRMDEIMSAQTKNFSKILTAQTDRIVKVLKSYDERSEKHDRNFKNIKKVIE